jgi:hypothetical protein
MRRDDIQRIIYDSVRVIMGNELCKPFSEYIINHFLYKINKYRENFRESFEAVKESFNNLVEIYKIDQHPVFSDILKYYMKSLLYSSYLADQELSKKKEKVNCIDECGRVFMSFFSKFSNGTDNSSIFYCIISLTRIYFKLKTYRNSKTLIEWVDRMGVDIDNFPKSEVTTFYYYSGRLSLYELKLTDANKILSNAFNLCKDNHFMNKRLLLEYLVPLKLFEGVLPSEYILKKYNLEQYNDLIVSFKEGNLSLYENAIETLEDRLITLGTFLIVEKLKPYLMRNIIKSIYTTYYEELAKLKTPIIKLELILNVLANVTNYTSMDLEELEIYIISVIFKGFINGYIHNTNKVIVLAKQNAFPKISDVFKNNYNKII